MTITARPMILKVPLEVHGVDCPAGVAVSVDEPRATRLEEAGKAEAWAIGSSVPLMSDAPAEEEAEGEAEEGEAGA